MAEKLTEQEWTRVRAWQHRHPAVVSTAMALYEEVHSDCDECLVSRALSEVQAERDEAKGGKSVESQPKLWNLVPCGGCGVKIAWDDEPEPICDDCVRKDRIQLRTRAEQAEAALAKEEERFQASENLRAAEFERHGKERVALAIAQRDLATERAASERLREALKGLLTEIGLCMAAGERVLPNAPPLVEARAALAAQPDAGASGTS